MNLASITPTKLRIILLLCLLVLSAIGVALFTVGYNRLQTFATSAQTVASEAEASQSSIQDLVATKALLAQNEDAVKRASQLVAESQSYVYQDQIISDINTFAGESGLSITNISFATPITTAVAAAPAAPTAGAGAGAGVAATPAGVKSMTASVTIKNPTDYMSMLRFTHLIEQSLFRMQVSQVGISASADVAHPNQVNSDILTIEVYVR